MQVDWINPHAWVHVEDVKEDGTTQVWQLEAGTPNTLLRRGLTRKLLQPGTEVVVRGYQSKDKVCVPICSGSGRDITFPDGTKIFMGSSGTGAPRDGADPTEPSQEEEQTAQRGRISATGAGWASGSGIRYPGDRTRGVCGRLYNKHRHPQGLPAQGGRT